MKLKYYIGTFNGETSLNSVVDEPGLQEANIPGFERWLTEEDRKGITLAPPAGFNSVSEWLTDLAKQSDAYWRSRGMDI